MAKNKQNLALLIERGGIYYKVPGKNPKELLASLIGLLPPVPSLDPKNLYRETLEREALASTGIGRGIALPHPRNPILGEDSEALAAIAFPIQPVDWNNPDGSEVHTVILIVSSSVKQHLNTLTKISFLCRQEKFHSLITEQSSKEDIIAAIREAEASWSSL
jgi:PTS system nitrogen regulatory IIA component